MSIEDVRFMVRALQLAEHGLYTTDPNPRVGCVIVKNGEVVGEGWHRKAGEPHAERLALVNAGAAARGAAVYVTLEPCAHHGRTPPCADALIEAGVGRVVAAMQDPNPLVAGQGMERLRAAGIATASDVQALRARALNPGFIKRMESGRPYVRCKLAMSLDGRTAMASGESQWITGADARRDVQMLRARSSAIVTGVGTVLADDPSMNVRLTARDLPGMDADACVRQPTRVVLDSRLRTPPHARLIGLPGETWLVTTRSALIGDRRGPLEQAGAQIVELPNHSRIDLGALMAWLASREVNEVLLETGPALAGSALAAGLIDELIIYIAAHVMGDGAQGLFHLPELQDMSDRVALEWLDVRAVGQDLRIRARPKAAVQNTLV